MDTVLNRTTSREAQSRRRRTRTIMSHRSGEKMETLSMPRSSKTMAFRIRKTSLIHNTNRLTHPMTDLKSKVKTKECSEIELFICEIQDNAGSITGSNLKKSKLKNHASFNQSNIQLVSILKKLIVLL
jgi:hypothetical protein